MCGKKINTVCCSCCALQCSECCHLDIAAASAADSECVDGGEILPVIEDFKAAELSQKAWAGLCQCTLMMFLRLWEPTRISSCMHLLIVEKPKYSTGGHCCLYGFYARPDPVGVFKPFSMDNEVPRALLKKYFWMHFYCIDSSYIAFMLRDYTLAQ